MTLLEEIVKRNDQRFDRMDQRLDRIEHTLSAMNGKLENLIGRVSQLPNTWQYLAGLVGLGGFLFAALRWTGH